MIESAGAGRGALEEGGSTTRPRPDVTSAATRRPGTTCPRSSPDRSNLTRFPRPTLDRHHRRPPVRRPPRTPPPTPNQAQSPGPQEHHDRYPAHRSAWTCGRRRRYGGHLSAGPAPLGSSPSCSPLGSPSTPAPTPRHRPPPVPSSRLRGSPWPTPTPSSTNSNRSALPHRYPHQGPEDHVSGCHRERLD